MNFQDNFHFVFFDYFLGTRKIQEIKYQKVSVANRHDFEPYINNNEKKISFRKVGDTHNDYIEMIIRVIN